VARWCRTFKNGQTFNHAASSGSRTVQMLIRDPRCHGRRHPQSLMTAAEVVEREPARDSSPVVLTLLAETVGEASEAAKPHPLWTT
jgi:hypothetical protein